MIVGQFDVEFRRDGSVFDQEQAASLLSGLRDASDLLVLSHGWNNDRADAEKLYDAFLANLTQLQERAPDGAAPKLAVLRVFWPSKKFTDADLIPGGGVASADAENDGALLRALSALKHDPDRLGEAGEDSARAGNIDQATALIDQLETSESARREFVLRIRSVLNPDEAHEDDGSCEFFDRDPEELFDAFSVGVPVDLPVGEGGVAAVSDGGAAFLGDLLSGTKAAARRITNFGTYYQMKARAATVGRTGLASLLLRVRERYPQLPVHLVGHSFGGRLVTAAASMIEPGDAPVTMTLLQAAYSHNGLGRKFDGRNDGAFRRILDRTLISGPVVITHTKNDLAVGIAYPLASRIARDNSTGLGDQDDPYGGMGRNGARHTPEVSLDETELRAVAVGPGYSFRPGNVYNLNADKFITEHNDVTSRPVVNAVLAAMGTR